jgi:hypothetical protein
MGRHPSCLRTRDRLLNPVTCGLRTRRMQTRLTTTNYRTIAGRATQAAPSDPKTMMVTVPLLPRHSLRYVRVRSAEGSAVNFPWRRVQGDSRGATSVSLGDDCSFRHPEVFFGWRATFEILPPRPTPRCGGGRSRSSAFGNIPCSGGSRI